MRAGAIKPSKHQLGISRYFCCLLLLALTLIDCGGDHVAWGYINRLPYPVTLVRHVGSERIRTTLLPNQPYPGGTGPNVGFDLIGPDGIVKHYAPADLPIVGDDSISYVVIRDDKITVEPRQIAFATQSRLPRGR